MREIKFRGKRVDNGEWVYGMLDCIYKDDGVTTISYLDNEGYYCEDKVDYETVGQFIGVLDKNSREMYEDDVMQIVNGKCKVDMHYSTLYHIEHHKIEVIGNIHDNPELLK